LAVANSQNGTVSVFSNVTAPGATTPAFAAPQTFAVGTNPVALVAADVNNDGRPDLVVVNQGSATISVLLNTGFPGGTPAFAPQVTFAVGNGAAAVAAGDINGDGRIDLAVANQTDNTVSVLFNSTAPGSLTPTFSNQQPFATGKGPRSVALGDFNGDGHLDLAVANGGSTSPGNTVSVLLSTTAPGAATPSFAAQQTFTVGNGPVSVAVGDVNGDGRPDLATANFQDGTVSVLIDTTSPGSATAAFAAQQTIAAGPGPSAVALGDLNGDGRPDLAVSDSGTTGIPSNTVSVLLDATTPGSTAAAFSMAQTFATGNAPAAVAIGDVNGDGQADLAVASPNDNAVAVLLNTRTPITFSPSFASTLFPGGSGPISLAVGDFNNDGKPDLAVVDASADSVVVQLNTTPTGAATPTFGTAIALAVGKGPSTVVVADFNGDGKPDLAVANYAAATVSVLLNSTAPGASVPAFSAQQTLACGHSPQPLVAGDFNNDGRPDIVTVNQKDNTVSVLLNGTLPGATAAGFAAQRTFSVGTMPNGAVVADFNGDGRPDLAVANFTGNTVSVLLNTTLPGATVAGFGAQQTFAAGTALGGMAAADFNGDGRPDLAVVNQIASQGLVSVLINTTTLGGAIPQFGAAQTFAVGHSPDSVAVGDFNGDGRPDLVVSNFDDNTVSVLLNTAAPGAGAASFGPQQAFVTGGGPFQVAVADWNGDGLPDLATSDVGDDTVTVLLNTAAPITISGSPATGTILDDDAPAGIVVTGPSSQSATVGGPFAMPLTVTVTNASGNPVADISVIFAAPASGPGGSFNGSLTATVATDANGVAVAPAFTANTLAGNYTVTATASGGNSPAVVFNLTNTAATPAAIVATSGSNQSASFGSNFAAPLVVTVTDAFGNPVPGVAVTFTGPASGPSATFPGGATAITGANGQATVTAAANGIAGSYSVTATVAGVATPATFVGLTNTAATAAATIAAVSGSGQSAGLNTAFANPLVVSVTDASGHPVAGAVVTFTAPSSGPGATFPGGATTATGVTNASGTATAPVITANRTAGGPYVITASVTGVATPATFSLTNVVLPGPAYATGADAGGGPQVNVYDAKGNLMTAFQAYSQFFIGGVRVAVADVNGDGVADIITAPGPSGGPDIRIYDGKTFQLIGEFLAYNPAFLGGVFVAAGNVMGGGKAEIVTGPDQGGGPDVRVFDMTGKLLREFAPYATSFTGGVRVAVGDVDADGFADIITGAGPSGGPNVTVTSGQSGVLLSSFQAFSPFFTGGVYVAAGDVNGDGHADIIVGAGASGGPNVVVFNGANPAQILDNFLAYNRAFIGGVRVAAADVNGDGRADIITGAGPSGGPNVIAFDALSLQPLDSFFAYNQHFLGGVFVGGQ
jgi:hypothetical protein